MDENQAIEHGRRWLAVGWRWVPGQVAIPEWSDGDIALLVTSVSPAGLPCSQGDVVPGAVPDVSGPHMYGHAIGQLRDAWGDPLLCTRASYNLRGELWWAVTSIDRDNADLPPCGTGGTEAAALLAAREAAP